MRLSTTFLSSALTVSTVFTATASAHYLQMHGGCSDYHNYESGYRQPDLARVRDALKPACNWLQGTIDEGASHYHDIFDVPVGVAEDEIDEDDDGPVGTVRLRVLNLKDVPLLFSRQRCESFYDKLIFSRECTDGANRTTMPTPIGYDVDYDDDNGGYRFRVQAFMSDPELPTPPKDDLTEQEMKDLEEFPW